ncbi:MAG: hypothetical protein KC486_04930 [Myxococcales bacterium]|nr:hypothetical protein [Myxococcales bacterium]
MVGGFRVIAVEREYASGSLQNLFVGVWRVGVTREAVAGLYGGLRGLIREWPGGVGMLLYVEKGTVVPPPEVRQFLIDQRREVAPSLVAASLAVEGDDLWSATVRTIAVTLGLASGTNYPSKSFASLAEAIAWQRAQMGAEFNVPDDVVARAVASLREQPVRG